MSWEIQTAFITLADQNSEKLVEFYGQFLNQEPNPYRPNVYAEFQLPGLRLGIFQPQDCNWPEFARQQPSPMSLCLEVKNLESAIAHLSALGYPPPGKILVASHGREIYAYDPAQNRLILHESR